MINNELRLLYAKETGRESNSPSIFMEGYTEWLERKYNKAPSEFEMEELNEEIDSHVRAVERLLEKFCVNWQHKHNTRLWAYGKEE